MTDGIIATHPLANLDVEGGEPIIFLNGAADSGRLTVAEARDLMLTLVELVARAETLPLDV